MQCKIRVWQLHEESTVIFASWRFTVAREIECLQQLATPGFTDVHKTTSAVHVLKGNSHLLPLNGSYNISKLLLSQLENQKLLYIREYKIRENTPKKLSQKLEKKLGKPKLCYTITDVQTTKPVTTVS